MLEQLCNRNHALGSHGVGHHGKNLVLDLVYRRRRTLGELHDSAVFCRERCRIENVDHRIGGECQKFTNRLWAFDDEHSSVLTPRPLSETSDGLDLRVGGICDHQLMLPNTIDRKLTN